MIDKNKTVRIDFVSDVVCPWCAIGYSQLNQALNATGVKADIHWHPYELNPDIPLEGKNGIEYGAEKYGRSLAESHQNFERITNTGAQAGFEFRFNDDFRVWNTFMVHQLIHWAEGFKLAHPLKVSLFSAHFTEHRNLSDIDTLAALAERVGLDSDEATEILKEQRYANEVRQRQKHWIEQGVQGVPAIIFNEEHQFSGAQGTDNFIRILQHATGLAPEAS